MKANNIKWPGSPKEDGSFFVKITLELAKDFSQSSNQRSKRISVVLQNLASAMLEDSKAYYDMFTDLQKFYQQMSEDWNSLYVKKGGKIGSGAYIKAEIDVEASGIVDQYSPLGIMKIQAIIPFLRDSIAKLPKTNPEAERIHIIHVFYSSIFNGIILQDKWFDKVENSINSNAQDLILKSTI